MKRHVSCDEPWLAAMAARGATSTVTQGPPLGSRSAVTVLTLLITSEPGPAFDVTPSPAQCWSFPAESCSSRPSFELIGRLLRGGRRVRRWEHLQLAPAHLGESARSSHSATKAARQGELAAEAEHTEVASPASGGLSRHVHGVSNAPGEPDFHVWRSPTGRGRGDSQAPAGRSPTGSHFPGFTLRERGAGETVCTVRRRNPVEAPLWALRSRPAGQRPAGLVATTTSCATRAPPRARPPQPLLSASRASRCEAALQLPARTPENSPGGEPRGSAQLPGGARGSQSGQPSLDTWSSGAPRVFPHLGLALLSRVDVQRC